MKFHVDLIVEQSEVWVNITVPKCNNFNIIVTPLLDDFRMHDNGINSLV